MCGNGGFDVDTEVLRRLATHLCEVDAPRIRDAVDDNLLGCAIISTSAWGHVEFLDLEGVAAAYEDARGAMAVRGRDIADHLCPGMSDLLRRTADVYAAAETRSNQGVLGTGVDAL